MIENLLLLLFILLLIHYLIFLSKIYIGLNKIKKETPLKLSDEFISVLVPFRNEEKNILRVLQSLESQNYPEDKFEVIFIDDNSTDNSKKILEENLSKKNFKVLSVPSKFSDKAHKKRAIRFGIENSKGEIIVSTDADCIHPQNWLRTLVSYFEDKTGFISGPVKFIDQDTLFSKLQSLEFAGLVITGAGLIGSNYPVICNAANIAYRRKVFEDVGGFALQMDLSSGDDELLMQKVFRDTNYKIQFVPEADAIVETEPNESLKQFYQQRKRWASKGLFYKNRLLITKLILIYLFYLSLFLQPLIGFLIDYRFFIPFVLSILSKIFIEYLILKKGLKLIFNQNISKVFFLAEIFHIPYIIIAGLSGVFGNYKWKDRHINR